MPNKFYSLDLFTYPVGPLTFTKKNTPILTYVCVYLALTNKRNEIGKEDLRVCPREDWAGVTYAILPISFKLSQFMRVTKLLKNPELFGLPANPWVIKAPHEILG